MEIEAERLPKGLRRKGLPEKLAEICIKNDVTFMAIFGSYARDEQHPKSDVDIAIKFDPEKPKSLLDLIELQEQLQRAFKKKVDLGTFNSIKSYIIEDVKKRCTSYMKKNEVPQTN